jgi:Leucine-rich repeat (LRR) protein
LTRELSPTTTTQGVLAELEEIVQAAPSLLTSLKLPSNEEENLELLAQCTNLRSVVIDGSSNAQTPSLAPLAQCPSLEHVSLSWCKWTNVGELAPVTQLRSLSIVRNKVGH